MDPETAQWNCLAGTCGHGDLFDYHAGKFKVFGHRQAEHAVLSIIRDAEKQVQKAEEAARAARDRTVEDSPAFVKNLLRLIDRHPEGILRRDLQQRSHLLRKEFRKALRVLQLSELIRSQSEPRTARKPRIVYFPVVDPCGSDRD